MHRSREWGSDWGQDVYFLDFLFCTGTLQGAGIPSEKFFRIRTWKVRPGPQIIKLFFMLSSAETKIYPADKC